MLLLRLNVPAPMIQEYPPTAEEIAGVVARVANSRTFRGKETLQRLLIYLGDRTLNGSAEALKEHTIGVEVFGKPNDYDPQEDASVRVQIGRLRQKLEEYSRADGASDPIIIELPKRQFALQFHYQAQLTEAAPAVIESESAVMTTVSASATGSLLSPQPWRQLSWPSLLLGALIVALVWAGWHLWQPRASDHRRATGAENRQLNELWRPFLASDRSVTMAMRMRPFLRYDRGVIWEWGLNEKPSEEQEAGMVRLQRRLNTRILAPWEKTYTSFGEANGVFLLTRLFEGHNRDLELKRNDTLTWEEIAERNVIFLGAGKYGAPFDRIPVEFAFEQRGDSIVNLHPRVGETATFTTVRPAPPDFAQSEDYALISLVPGLHGKGAALAFGAASSSGLWAAVQYMTDPRYAGELISKLKGDKELLPLHYQVVIHARFQSLVPVEIKYVLHREL
jgi:hypothetical protein